MYSFANSDFNLVLKHAKKELDIQTVGAQNDIILTLDPDGLQFMQKNGALISSGTGSNAVIISLDKDATSQIQANNLSKSASGNSIVISEKEGNAYFHHVALNSNGATAYMAASQYENTAELQASFEMNIGIQRVSPERPGNATTLPNLIEQSSEIGK